MAPAELTLTRQLGQAAAGVGTCSLQAHCTACRLYDCRSILLLLLLLTFCTRESAVIISSSSSRPYASSQWRLLTTSDRRLLLVSSHPSFISESRAH